MIQEKEPIKQELLEILTKYYDGSFARLVQEYIRTSGITEEEREALVEVVINWTIVFQNSSPG